MSDDIRAMIELHLINVYGGGWSQRCPGCGVQEVGKPHPCMGADWCDECEKATVGYKGLEPRNISADDVTWAILPYVAYQYENRC